MACKEKKYKQRKEQVSPLRVGYVVSQTQCNLVPITTPESFERNKKQRTPQVSQHEELQHPSSASGLHTE